MPPFPFRSDPLQLSFCFTGVEFGRVVGCKYVANQTAVPKGEVEEIRDAGCSADKDIDGPALAACKRGFDTALNLMVSPPPVEEEEEEEPASAAQTCDPTAQHCGAEEADEPGAPGDEACEAAAVEAIDSPGLCTEIHSTDIETCLVGAEVSGPSWPALD